MVERSSVQMGERERDSVGVLRTVSHQRLYNHTSAFIVNTRLSIHRERVYIKSIYSKCLTR